MTNYELRQLIFDKIESLGYKIKNVVNPDGYFIIDMGKDSVTHFNLKGKNISKHWKFGLWCEEKYFDPEYFKKCKDEYNMKENDIKAIQLFAQWDTNIDKFKPSRSALCLSWSVNDIKRFCENKENDYFMFSGIERMLGFMRKHPLMAYEEFCGEYAGYYNDSFILNFLKYEGLNKWNFIKRLVLRSIWVPYTKAKCSLLKHNKMIDDVECFSFEEKYNLSTSYQYEVNIRFKENVSDEEMLNIMNFWWHKKNYGNCGYYDYIIAVNRITQVGSDESLYYSE